jgi:hypothetical protein
MEARKGTVPAVVGGGGLQPWSDTYLLDLYGWRFHICAARTCTSFVVGESGVLFQEAAILGSLAGARKNQGSASQGAACLAHGVLSVPNDAAMGPSAHRCDHVVQLM